MYGCQVCTVHISIYVIPTQITTPTFQRRKKIEAQRVSEQAKLVNGGAGIQITGDIHTLAYPTAADQHSISSQQVWVAASE